MPIPETGPLSWPCAVVFDLDGTLVDSVGDIADSLTTALAGEGLPSVPIDQVRLMIGRGARILVERALAALKQPLNELQIQRIEQKFEAHYSSLGSGRSLTYPGGIETLAALRADGRKLAICTNKPERIARIVLDSLGVSPYLNALVGAGPDVPKKPNPTMLTLALEAMRVTPAQAIMVGDSHTDVELARNLGMPVIVVSYGYSAIPATELGADLVVDRLSDLRSSFAMLAQS